MISFENKNILIINADTALGENISLKLSELGANLILIGNNEDKLTNIIAQTKKAQYIINYINIDKCCSKVDMIVYCNFFIENNERNHENYLTFIDKISILQHNNKNTSVVLLSKNENEQSLKKDLNTYIHQEGINNLAKVLSHKYINQKIRFNTVIMDINTIEPASNLALYLISDSSKFIVGEKYDITND